MDLYGLVSQGFAVAFQPNHLFLCFFGCLMGTLVGVLPGLGPTAAIALLLPTTFHFTPVAAIITLSGIYYGAMYGGSTTSILVNIPGEAASVVTTLDGYKMALDGRAGPALGIAAFGSYIAGTLSIVGLMFLAPPLASAALAFGPPEYFALMCLGLTILIYLASGSIIKALMMAALGLVIGCIGADMLTNVHRFTLGIPELMDGVGLIPLVMGLFGISEVLLNIEVQVKQEILKGKIKNLLPNLQEWKASAFPILRGTLIGFLLGILPGSGATISSFVSYAVEKKVSKHPEKFGTGAIEGVAGPESANNAATGGAFIPLFSLGIPSNPVMAVLLGALMIHGIVPGPNMLRQNPDLFWGVVVSMYVGNAMLLVLNLPLIGLWVRLLKVPYAILFPLILLFCLIGGYTVNNKIVDVYIMILFGIAGYLLRKFRYESAPLILAFVLGPLLEDALRQSLIISEGDP
ncbi:MAG: tripartite tricarboxylate transporter permease, partial [Deltaproteobacteria bacterium]|nr:tripartite tricarboxylate transporter permease [Deltaproteobacteria bacterium]